MRPVGSAPAYDLDKDSCVASVATQVARAPARGLRRSGTESSSDSLLEGNGFELPVRRSDESGCRPFFLRRLLETGGVLVHLFFHTWLAIRGSLAPTTSPPDPARSASELAQTGPLNAVEREETSLPAFKSRTNHQATEG